MSDALPIEDVLPDLCAALDRHGRAVLVAPPGAGKTTRVPLALLDQIDGRILMAGEHVSYLPAWQEGAITSALDAISRLHDRVING